LKNVDHFAGADKVIRPFCQRWQNGQEVRYRKIFHGPAYQTRGETPEKRAGKIEIGGQGTCIL
jgi:hypothetical protein